MLGALPVGDIVVTFVWHTFETKLPSRHRMMAQLKQTMRKTSVSYPHLAWLFATIGVEQVRPLSKDVKVVEGDIEHFLLVVTMRPENLSLRREMSWWQAEITLKRNTQRLDLWKLEAFLEKVEAFLPSPGQLATNPEGGYCACSGPHAKQDAMLHLHPYFKEMAKYYHNEYQWLTATTDKEVSKIDGFIEDYYFVKDMGTKHVTF
uniref:Uncharacterized protein n=1 Tax=Cannabis sativa TaxID=3483 RepID=A0A803PY71_CANSA